MAGTSPLVQALNARLALHPELDPKAVDAIASHEGLSGGIGDGGHAFGPFQLNNAGGVITGKFGGESPGQINQWAWSPQGIDYALQAISKAAGGLKGLPAIQAITTQFERPANPQAEIADAAHHYGLPYTGSGSIQIPSAAATPGATGVAMPSAAPMQPRVPIQRSPIGAALKLLGFGGLN